MRVCEHAPAAQRGECGWGLAHRDGVDVGKALEVGQEAQAFGIGIGSNGLGGDVDVLRDVLQRRRGLGASWRGLGRRRLGSGTRAHTAEGAAAPGGDSTAHGHGVKPQVQWAKPHAALGVRWVSFSRWVCDTLTNLFAEEKNFHTHLDGLAQDGWADACMAPCISACSWNRMRCGTDQ